MAVWWYRMVVNGIRREIENVREKKKERGER